MLRIPTAGAPCVSREALSRVATQNPRMAGAPRTGGRPAAASPIDANRERSDQVADGGQGQVTLVSPDSEGGVRDGDATGGRSGDADTAALQNELAIHENLDRLNRKTANCAPPGRAGQVGTSQRSWKRARKSPRCRRNCSAA